MKELDVAVDAAREAGAIVRSLYGTGLAAVEKGTAPTVRSPRRTRGPTRRCGARSAARSRTTAGSPRSRGDTGGPPREATRVDRRSARRHQGVRAGDSGALRLRRARRGRRPDRRRDYNPIRDELYAAARGDGATFNGDADARQRQSSELRRAVVLASRSETERGEWDRFRGRFRLERVRLGRVQAGAHRRRPARRDVHAHAEERVGRLLVRLRRRMRRTAG